MTNVTVLFLSMLKFDVEIAIEREDLSSDFLSRISEGFTRSH